MRLHVLRGTRESLHLVAVLLLLALDDLLDLVVLALLLAALLPLFLQLVALVLLLLQRVRHQLQILLVRLQVLIVVLQRVHVRTVGSLERARQFFFLALVLLSDFLELLL